MAQRPHQHEYLSLDPQNPCFKKSSVVMCVCYPVLGGDRKIPGSCWVTSLTQSGVPGQ